MKALTLWQPWASLIAVGAKTIETRSWSTAYRGPLLIHAAKRRPDVPLFLGGYGLGHHRIRYADRVDEGFTLAATTGRVLGDGTTIHRSWPLPLGAVVALCRLVDVLPILDRDERLDVAWTPHVAVAPGYGRLTHWKGRTDHDGPMGRPTWVTSVIEDQRPYGDFTPGRYAWLLDHVQALPEPVPAKGRQGLWTPDADLLAAVEAAA